MAKNIIVYGLKSCDTVKKATDWLSEHGLAFSFHNFKTDGISKEKLDDWMAQAKWTEILNRNSTTFKAISEDEKLAISSAAKARKFLMSNTSAIKRPLIEINGTLAGLGFNAEAYQKMFE